MKKLLLGALMAFFGSQVSAQLADGSTAPNFTITDIDGNTHNLYDLLGEGKTVVIDLFATWCVPCWNYHQDHVLEDLYNQEGPDGTDRMMVFAIESDANTPESDIYAASSTSEGDWTNGISYPIANDHSVAGLYELSYYPTIFLICPDTTAWEVGQLSDVEAFLEHGCKSGTNNARLTGGGFNFAMCEAYTPEFDLQNLGQSDLTSCTITLKEGTTVVETINWTGDLETYEEEEVLFSAIDNITSERNFTVEVTNVNGGSDDVTSNNQSSASIDIPEKLAIGGTEINISMVSDGYSDEVRWGWFGSDGEIIEVGGNYQRENAGVEFENKSFQVSEGECYHFLLVDDYGDGVSDDDAGKIQITDADDGSAIYLYDFGSMYAADINVTQTTVLSINDNENYVAVYPNPSNGQFMIQSDYSENVTIEVYDVLGALVWSENNLNITNNNINLTALKAGNYMIKVIGNNTTSTQKIIIE